MMNIQDYIDELNALFATGNATEHTYRPALQSLVAAMLPELAVLNEPKRVACGAPDYIVLREGLPSGYIEAKDIDDTDLWGAKKNKEQFERYKQSLHNIIFTDYLRFYLFENETVVAAVAIGEVRGNEIVALPEKFAEFEQLIARFGCAEPQPITTSDQLTKFMAGKARLLANVIERAIVADTDGRGELYGQMKAFEALIHDITPKTFADVFAQTIAYGMFAARLHDKTLHETFTRQKAAELIPKTNPLLRTIFQGIAGFDLDDSIRWIVDDLAKAFQVTNAETVMIGFKQREAKSDPIMHFYEDFLAEYDPALRKSRGVWYTPQPVVEFIVRAVDEILQSEFGIADGLADISKATVQVERPMDGKTRPGYDEVEMHKVHILDPATGTGTFLAGVINCIYDKMQGQQGLWQSYVENNLIPRLNGFEVLMASYAMAHLKLERLLAETGYVPKKNERLGVYLTNSLEEFHSDVKTFFMKALANEANEANSIKRDAPVMVVLGNPPYSGESSNKGEWIAQLMKDYKCEPDNPQMRLKERAGKWLNDDYCKFIRLGQSFVDKNHTGILAYINNHSFIDNPTFRGMRWNLMQSFDKIYIIDLHGSSKKREVCPDGSKDENVFDIQQGVSINIFVKTGKKREGQLAEVYHCDVWGKRQAKFDLLKNCRLGKMPFVKLAPASPNYFFIPQDNRRRKAYMRGFSIVELMPVNSVGVVTARDEFIIDYSRKALLERITKFCDLSISDYEIRQQYFKKRQDEKYLAGDTRSWELAQARKTITTFAHHKIIRTISYRPFDERYIYYHSTMVDWQREKVMRNFIGKDNIGLLTCRQSAVKTWEHVGITKHIVESSIVSNRTKEIGYVFPLYTYPQNDETSLHWRTPNLNDEIVQKIAKKLKLEFAWEKSGEPGQFAPVDLLDYIYGVLHTPAYRERYKAFLKIDFPRIPYPEEAVDFWRIADIGARLRKLHLMEDLPPLITQFNVAGTNKIERVMASEPDENGNIQVWINADQCFAGVPQVAWEFYMGGYQPAQKWLKDRKENPLTSDDIMHYQRIITALAATHKLMQEL